MGLAAQLMEHAAGVGLVVWLAHHLVAEDNDGVGRDNQFVGSHRLTVGGSLLLGDIFGYLARGQVGRIALVDAIDDTHLEVEVKACQQFLATGRITRQYYLPSALFHLPFLYHPKALSSFSHLP